MKKWMILIGFLATIQQSAHADEITLVADTWCPYSCDPSSDQPGILIEVAKIILEQAGHTVVYKEM
ncbi:MAG: hypothetical protein HOH77_05165, partial [Candidatus Latescibacteria bacterium]|nr:hypothetical protein [Candidatus Latescibacterota bacterium]